MHVVELPRPELVIQVIPGPGVAFPTGDGGLGRVVVASQFTLGGFFARCLGLRKRNLRFLPLEPFLPFGA